EPEVTVEAALEVGHGPAAEAAIGGDGGEHRDPRALDELAELPDLLLDRGLRRVSLLRHPVSSFCARNGTAARQGCPYPQPARTGAGCQRRRRRERAAAGILLRRYPGDGDRAHTHADRPGKGFAPRARL